PPPVATCVRATTAAAANLMGISPRKGPAQGWPPGAGQGHVFSHRECIHPTRLCAHVQSVMPLSLSDHELDQLLGLAQPVPVSRRREFLEAVSGALQDYPDRGPGLLHRMAATLQQQYLNVPDHSRGKGIGKHARG